MTRTPPPAVRVFGERVVPLGGLRGIEVARSLPQRELARVGPWCFLDRFGPTRMAMHVLPHPHTQLQTVTYLTAGALRHRDSVGSDQVVRPGEVNLMTAGHGVSHSEFSLLDDGSEAGDTVDLPATGLQFWVALPDDARDVSPAFEHHGELPELRDGPLALRVLMGEFAGEASPATTYSPVVGLDIRCAAPTTFDVPLEPEFEYAVLVTEGAATIAGVPTTVGSLVWLGQGRSALTIEAGTPGRLMLLGGAPLDDEIFMWWNFIARSHDEIVAQREAWEAGDVRFGTVAGHGDARIPAPPMPHVRLKPRRAVGASSWDRTSSACDSNLATSTGPD